MRHLSASTCFASIAIATIAGSARAETLIETKRETTAQTSTIKSGAADDIRITSAGSVVVASGVGVLLDSVNKVTNEGTVQITNADNAVGIQAIAGGSGTITNSGKIIVDETFAATDADKDGDLDGPFATGTGRYGIRTAGAFTGDVVNSGTITIEGKDSAGIALGGPLTGKFTTSGSIQVTGDRSVGVRTGDITGPVRIAGSISAQGLNASAASIEGNITGALVVQGTLTATGYRTVTPPTDTSKLDADDLLQGGPALNIAGNVSGGIILAVPPKDSSSSDNDEDKDGIEDSKEGSASVTSYGSAAAVQIGSATQAIAVGPVAGTANGHGLIIDGAVVGAGTYAGIGGNGVVIGGLGQNVTIAGGITVGGSVQATSSGASATAIRIDSGATVPEIRISGTVAASGGGTTTSKSTAVAIEAGSQVGIIRNSGQIKATASGVDGSATAIVDRSGNVATIENSGVIAASGAAANSTRNIAIDLSANTSGATISQTVVATGTAPSISGDILLGSGNDVLDVADGSITGTSSLGAGSNRLSLSGDATFTGTSQFGAGDDTVTLGGTSTFTGMADFGGGNDSLTIGGTSKFVGSFANCQGLAVAVNGGMLDLGKGTVALRSLAVSGAGTLGVTIDTATHTNTLYQISGAATFGEGSKVLVKLSDVANAEGRYVFLKADSIGGTANLGANDTVLPFLFKSGIVATTPTELAIDITRKNATELGLNRSQASAYEAVYKALGKDAKVAGVFLNTVNGEDFRRQLRQMLPDHAGGTFETVTMGSRATASFLADPNAPFADQGGWGYWIQQVGWGTSKSLGDTGSYDISGWGIATGGEIKSKIGSFGLSLAYLSGKDSDGGTDNRVTAGQYELGAYWHGNWGAFSANARASIAHIDFEGKRKFEGLAGTETVTRTARGDWNGRLVSASAGASYELYFGAVSLRPKAAVDYYRLREKGYSETSGGDAFDLIVDGKTSDELAVSGTVAAGIDFGGRDEDSGWFRIEAEGGRRQLVGGSLGSTTARFAGGDSFTLVPEDRTSGWVGKLRAVGGGNSFQIGGEAGAEQQQGRAAISLRASVIVGL